MTAFFQSQFSGGYTAPEYIPAPQPSKAEENTEELSQEELAQQKQIPGFFSHKQRSFMKSNSQTFSFQIGLKFI